MLSFLSCVGCRYCGFSPFPSMAFASHHTFRTRNCSKPRFIHETGFVLLKPHDTIWDTHEDKHKDTKTSWRHEEDMYNVDHTQKAKSAPNPAQRAHQSQTPPNPAQRPPEPNPTPSPPNAPSTAKSHAQPTRARQAEPNPRPTQHSAPTSVSNLFFSKIEPHR